MSKKPKPIVNARKINKMRWIASLVISAIIIITTLVLLTLNVINFYDYDTPEAGVGTFRMFTTVSNIIAAVAAFMCVPFQIDGLKHDKYKLPSWIVILLYVGAVGTTLTFTIALSVLSFTMGFVTAMFAETNLFMHTINPIFIMILFTLIISDTKIKFKYSFFTLIPISTYAFIYYIMVFALKKWNDTYQTNTYIPWPIVLILIILISFGISQLLRFLHNLMNKYITNNIRRYYLESSDYECERVSDAIMRLAKVESAFYFEGDDIYIPADIIAILSERYNASKVPLDILYDIYLETYLKNIKLEKETLN